MFISRKRPMLIEYSGPNNSLRVDLPKSLESYFIMLVVNFTGLMSLVPGIVTGKQTF